MEKRQIHPQPGWRTQEVWRWALLASIFFICCLLRLMNLEWKAIMHDEGLFVYYTHFQLYESWSYQYLPILHGPAMLHLQALIFHLFGSTTFTMRLGCALLGIGGFFWIYGLRPWLGRVGTWIALAFYTVSPGILYYQRFFRNDALYLFTTLWIVTSLAWWWRSRRPAWLASAFIGCVVLFTNKESSLFLYFSIFTFFILLLLQDLLAGLFEGKARPDHQGRLPRFPNPVWPALITWTVILLIITQVFEGLEYDDDVVRAIGHDWVLKDIRSVPLALGWMQIGPQDAPDAGPALRSGQFWRALYIGLFLGLCGVFSLFRWAVRHRVGARQLTAAFWNRTFEARWHVLGAGSFGLFLYLWLFTTGFQHPMGFFEIYEKTWSYWGGQHEWGRIGGPFHQHLLNMLLYELPAVLLVTAAWFGGLFRLPSRRILGIAFFLMLIAVAGFHHMMFSGLQIEPLPGASLVAVNVPFLKKLILYGALIGAAILVLPRSARVLVPLGFFGLVGYAIAFFNSEAWHGVLRRPLFREGKPVELSNQHVNLWEMMEIQFNFDGGASLGIVLVLIFFATVYTWLELSRGRRFRAFLIWWTVTATGAASYAREAVPQVGIHAMLPLILLAASYADEFLLRLRGRGPRLIFAGFLGFLLLWNAKAAINLNFYNADDPRERMVYGPIPRDLAEHSQFVLDYREIAPIRMENGVPAWHLHNNDPTREKDLRVGVATDPVVWAVRWYLREVEWHEAKDPTQFVDQDYEFLFVKQSHLRGVPEIEEKYHTFVGSAIRFWQPRSLENQRMVDIWKMLIPGHYLDSSPQAGQAYEAKQEWRRIWRYLILREVWGGASGTQYVFCVRKDLY